jgi:hypothetical protein
MIPSILVAALTGVAPPTITVPRTTESVTIDGHLDVTEWRGAVRARWTDGNSMRLQHDGNFLYVAVESPRSGFVSLCHADGDSVRILHASAALGSVRYGRSGVTWSSRDTAFAYGMRNTDTTAAAREERQSYLAQHGWVSTTVRMSGGQRHEMQLALEHLGRAPRIAVAFFVIGTADSFSIQRWPDDLSAQDGCNDAQLVRGYVPQGLRFDPTGWAELRL